LPSNTTAIIHCLERNREFKFEEYAAAVKAGGVLQCSCGRLIRSDLVFLKDELPRR
jgi:hypothetical protein